MWNKEKDIISIIIGKYMVWLRVKFNLLQKEIHRVIGVNICNLNLMKEYYDNGQKIQIKVRHLK